MARIFGTVLILAGCAGFLYKWAEGEKARQRMAGEWDTPVCALGICTGSRNMCGVRFLSFYETADASMQAFLDEVCVCMRSHQNPSGHKIWQDCLQKHKRELQIGRRAGKSLRLPREHFMAKAVQRICDAMKSAEKRMEKFLAESRLEFFKKQRVYLPVGNADRRGYDHSSGVKA